MILRIIFYSIIFVFLAIIVLRTFWPEITQYISKLIEKSPLEKQKQALEEAKERIRVAELQKETIRAEKEAMKIQDSILEEEFGEIDDEKLRKL